MRLLLVGITMILMFKSQVNLAFDIDYDLYKKTYPEAEFIVLKRKIRIDYFIDKSDAQLKAKSTHTLSILSLSNDYNDISLVQIPFSQYESVKIKSARYFLLDTANEKTLTENVKVKFAEEKDYYISGIFYNDLKVKQFAASFPIQEKSVLDYSYEVFYDDIKFLNRIYSQYEHENVVEFELKINIPSYLDLAVEQFNFSENEVNLKESKRGTLNQKTYRLKDIVDPLKGANTSTPSNYYLPHFVLVHKGYEYDGRQYELFNDVSDLYKWYRSLILQLAPNKPYIKQLADEVTQGINQPEDQIKALYQWVQQNINYVAFEDGIAGFKPTEAHKVVDLKYGDCKGMANILVELLQAKGFDARHTWIGTRRLKYDYTLPSLVVDNHMICTLIYDDDTYFLDATDKTADWRSAPSHIQGKSALVSRGKEFDIKQVPVTSSKENQVKFTMNSYLGNEEENGNRLMVNGNIILSGAPLKRNLGWYSQTRLKQQNVAVKILPKHYLSNYEPVSSKSEAVSNNEFKKLDIDGYVTGNIVKGQNKLYLFMDIDHSYSGMTSSDNSGIYLKSSKEITVKHRFKMPSNAKVNQLPESLSFNDDSNNLRLEISYKIEGNYVVFEKTLVVDKLYFGAELMNEWKGFSQKIEKALRTPVIIDLL